MTDAPYDLKTLCGEAGVTPRTVHFYIQAGLLRPVGMPGPGARYDGGHLARLRIIKLLQKEHLPLAEIRKRLESLDDAAVGAMLDECRSRRPASRTSAVDYIRSVLAGERYQLRAWIAPDAGMVKPLGPTPVQRVAERSQWERITLAPDVELHIRRPLSREQNRQVDRLMHFARELFEEAMP